jgi:hypothetical protein
VTCRWQSAINLGYTGLARAADGTATCTVAQPANLLQTGEGRIRLEPGGRLEATLAMRPRWLHG